MCCWNWRYAFRYFNWLKKRNNKIQIALTDPMGSSLYSHVKYKKLENTGSSITEGIGTGRITKF